MEILSPQPIDDQPEPEEYYENGTQIRIDHRREPEKPHTIDQEQDADQHHQI